jgi:polyisoprenoid-binding protein YceI
MESDHYAVDPGLSRFTVQAFAAGLFSAMGHNPTVSIRDFSGDAEFSPQEPNKGALRLKINAASLAVASDVSERDRREMESTMKEKVLESGRYPQIDYDASSISAAHSGDGAYRITLNGNLTLHGVTRSQPVAAQVTIAGNTLHAHGEFSLQQTVYGIKLVSVAGGTLKLKDELKCSFDIVAHKQPQSDPAAQS